MKRLLAFVFVWVMAGFSVGALAANSERVSVADISQFQQATSWSWTYFSKDARSGKWDPYYVETYVLTNVRGKILTFEMHSSPLPAHQTPAHHKFIVDFANCERAAAGGSRTWTMRFYTHSLGPGWQLVSNTYENTAFTEKFNCIVPTEKESVSYSQFDWQGAKTDIFSAPQSSNSGNSFYFLSMKDLNGVAAQKMFPPNNAYKFEFSGRVAPVQKPL